MAVNIPVDQNSSQLLDVLQNDRYEKVEKVMNDTDTDTDTDTDLYIGTRVVAAKPHNGHAEVRVLKNMDGLCNQSQDNFLVFYTYLSPCALQCANPDGDKKILDDIQYITDTYWKERHALVFGQPCTRLGGCEITKEQLEESFRNLKAYGFTNIFRCFFRNDVYQCHSCFLDQDVSEVCLEGAKSEQGGSAGSSQGVSTGGKRGSTEGTSRSAAAKRQKGPK